MRENEDDQPEPMHHRQILLKDGRYMIFYTFGDEEPTLAAENADAGEDV